MVRIEIEIPDGTHCKYDNGKPCILAAYTRKWGAYNCRRHNRILKGNENPIKCEQCAEECGRKTSNE